MAAIRRLQWAVAREPGLMLSGVGLALAVAAPTALRWVLDPLLGGSLWFATYYPAVLAATLLLGWRVGLASLLLSALVADFVFIPPPMTWAVEKRDVSAVLVYLFSAGLIVATAALLRTALARLNEAATLQAALNRELQHRVNNNLAVVQALAAQTRRIETEPEQFYAKFSDRLAALARAQDVLRAGNWTACTFPELPQTALEAFIARGAVAVSGEPCSVPTQTCVPLVLALHELATNAAKYGALSSSEGVVSLTWRLLERRQGAALELEWVESGGPPVREPERRGLGSRLLRAQPGLDEVSVDYAPGGVRCRIVLTGAASERSGVAPVVTDATLESRLGLA